MSIRQWPALERPREKLLAHGAANLSDAELLAIFLRTGVAGKTALDLSRQILQEFGGLRPLMAATCKQFCHTSGLGPAKYSLLQASIELSRRFFAERLRQSSVLDSPAAARAYLQAQLRDRQREIFACIYMDNRHRVLDYQEVFQGTINGASVHPREIVKQALEKNAAAILVAHNHPSGVAEPSQADQMLTRRLKAALALVDVRLLDHLVIGDGELVSFSERGLLE